MPGELWQLTLHFEEALDAMSFWGLLLLEHQSSVIQFILS
jgi:hypothetical protein